MRWSRTKIFCQGKSEDFEESRGARCGSVDRGASWAVWGKGRVAGVSYLAGLTTRVTTTWLTSIAAHPLGARLGMDQSGRIIGPSPDRGRDGLKRVFLALTVVGNAHHCRLHSGQTYLCNASIKATQYWERSIIYCPNRAELTTELQFCGILHVFQSFVMNYHKSNRTKKVS